LGEHRPGELKRESAQAKAERILRGELKRLGWTEGHLKRRAKSDPAKLTSAARLRRETALTLRELAARLALGTRKRLNAKLNGWKKANPPTAAGILCHNV
jgi:hypothetical protein